MRKTTSGLLSLALASGLGALLTVPIAAASPAAAPPQTQGSFGEPQTAAPSDSLPDPVADKQAELRKTAVASVLQGEAKPERIGNSTVVKVGEAERAATAAKGNRKAQKAKKVDQYVELAREKTDKIFVILVEFGDERHPELPGPGHRPGHPRPDHVRRPAAQRDPRAGPRGGQLHRSGSPTTTSALLPGPLLRQRPGPARVAASTYYEKQSSGRYSVDGEVTDWVKVRYNEARYGRSDGFPCASNVCSNTWDLVRDGCDAWVADSRPPAGTDAADRRRPASTTTSGTATTSTATATSTSPTATSTTSRSSTPAATRPTATRSRARTPSGPTAGTPSRAPTARARSRAT